ncbi:MAG: hypothetical protein ACRDXE_01570 [Acidimicrobiales bacterium]
MAAKQITVFAHWSPGTTGIVLFRPSAPLIDTSTAPATAYGTYVREAQISAAGNMSISVVATDDPAIVPTGQTWTVTEVVNGHREDPYDVIIPAAAAGGTVDLHSLARLSGPQAPAAYGTKVTVSATPPVAPQPGDLWVDIS